MYQTKDLYLAAYIFAAGQKFLGVSPSPIGNYSLFLFEDQVASQKKEAQFWSNTGSIVPLQYANAVKTLKNMLMR